MPPKSLHFEDFKNYLVNFTIEQGWSQCEKILFNDLISINMVKGNVWRFRAVYHIKTSYGDYFLKLSEALRSKDGWRHKLAPWHKWKEWHNLVKLTRKGFNAAEPCLRGIRKGKGPLAFFIVTRALNGRPLNAGNLNDMEAMGLFLANLHKGGVYMADLHLGNFMIDDAGKIGFFDVQRLNFLPVIGKSLRLRNLGFFMSNFKRGDLDTVSKESFLRAYNNMAAPNLTVVELNAAEDRARSRYAAKHNKRRFKRTSEFTVLKKDGLRGFARRGFSMDWKELLNSLTAETNIKENRVFMVNDLVIKRFPLRFLHADRCFTAFKMAYELESRNINTPQRMAYLKQGRYSYYVSSYLQNSVTVNEYFSGLKNEPALKRRMMRAFALWVSDVHNQDIYQHDFKSCNVLCLNEAFYMVDLEGIRLRRPTFDDKVYNLAQLNASMSKYVTLRGRLRFFMVYAAAQNIPANERREIWRKIWEIMLKKNTAYYDLTPDDITPYRTKTEKM